MNIVITGEHGYISKAIKDYLINAHKFNGKIRFLDIRNKMWLKEDFTGVDTIIQCATLVHKDSSQYSLDDYITVNAQLTEEIAKKSKESRCQIFSLLQY